MVEPLELPAAKSIEQIVVCTDLSAASVPALLMAGFLARSFQARLHLIHAIDESLDARLDFLASDLAQKLQRNAESTLQRFALSHPGKIETQIGVGVKRGRPGELILEACRKTAADLVICGTTSALSGDADNIGATAQQLAESCPIDVVLIRPQAGLPPKSLLVALKPDSECQVLMSRAAQVAQRTRAGRLDLVSAHHPSFFEKRKRRKDPNFVVHPAVPGEEARRSLQRHTPLSNHECEYLEIHGSIEDAVPQATNAFGSDLLFVGSRKPSRWKPYLFGNAAQSALSRFENSIWFVRESSATEQVTRSLAQRKPT